MGKVKQEIIGIMDDSRTSEMHGKYYTCHPTDPVPWSELHDFVSKLKAIYKLEGRHILEVNSYFNAGKDWFTGRQVKPDEHGIEITWVEAYDGAEY